MQLPVLCVSQGTAREAEQWASKLGLKPEEVRQVVDVGGRLTRYLGVELGIGEEGGPKSQRWAAILDNGVLLNLVCEGGGGVMVAGQGVMAPPAPHSWG